MRLTFRETMSGWVETPDGHKSFSFSIEAASPRARAIAGWSPMGLQGRASLDGVVEEAEILPGAFLWVGLPFHRVLRYHLSFRDPQGRLWRFHGTKDVRLTSPLRSMTTLRGLLFRNGVPYGKAELKFRLETLPAFLRSFRVTLGNRSDRKHLRRGAQDGLGAGKPRPTEATRQ